MEYHKEIDWNSPDIEIRMAIVMQEQEDSKSACCLRVSAVDKDGHSLAPLDLNAEQLQAVVCANAYLGNLLEEVLHVGSEAEGLANDAGFTLQ